MAAVSAGLMWSYNRGHAREVFEHLDYDRVLASRRLVLSVDAPWDACQYAVVELPQSAPDTPDRRFLPPIGLDTMWRPTPMAFREDGETLYEHWCEPNFSSRVFERMLKAVDTPGAWYAGGPYGAAVYSAEHRIAFVLVQNYPRF
ncbi:MAG: hypothetical protein AAGA87_16490 [Pseudomonadota bacterium]